MLNDERNDDQVDAKSHKREKHKQKGRVRDQTLRQQVSNYLFTSNIQAVVFKIILNYLLKQIFHSLKESLTYKFTI